MPSDKLITGKMILDAVLQLQREGSSPTLSHLEATEPELLNYLCESLSQLHGQLDRISSSGRKAQNLFRQIEHIILIALLAQRRGYQQLFNLPE
jgi:hypothetical protein